MWIAREKTSQSGRTSLLLFSEKPYRVEHETIDPTYTYGAWRIDGLFGLYMYIDSALFPELKWEDEPLEVELTVKQNKS